jgi:RNase H-fold protein (predicted Holliday junction resolvase)
MKGVVTIDSFQPQPGEIVVIRMNLNASQNAHAQAERAVEHFSELLPANHVVVIDERLTLERVHVGVLEQIIREQKRKQAGAA